MENKQYVAPEIEITTFTAKETITTSSTNNGIILPDDEW